MRVVKHARKGAVNFGTHNGIFHCDEVVGIAILELAHMNISEKYVVRTRDTEILKNLYLVIDVGGGKYDHHMSNFNTRRPTGEKYASAGLVWRTFADEAIKNVMAEENVSMTRDELENLKAQIDIEIILPVDLEDNGEGKNKHRFSFIPDFLPSYLVKEPDFDECFEIVENVVVKILKATIKSMGMKIKIKTDLTRKLSQVEKGILQIPAQNMTWTEIVVEHNKSHDNEVKFVMFPYPTGGWAAQAVPPSMEDEFGQLVPFPREWAGGNEKTLPEISGIKDATFCHNGRFFARAKTRESVIKMCEIAMSFCM